MEWLWQSGQFSTYSKLDDYYVRFVLDQLAWLDFNSVSWLQQQSLDRHVDPQ